jgi:hypothetical protein
LLPSFVGGFCLWFIVSFKWRFLPVSIVLCCWRILPLGSLLVNGGFCLFCTVPFCCWRILPLGSLLVFNGGFCLFYSIVPLFVVGGFCLCSLLF